MRIIYSIQIRKLTVTESISWGWTGKWKLIPLLYWFRAGVMEASSHPKGMSFSSVFSYSQIRTEPRPGWLMIQGGYPACFVSRREKRPLILKAIKFPQPCLFLSIEWPLSLGHSSSIQAFVDAENLVTWTQPAEVCQESSSQDLGSCQVFHQAPLFSFSSEFPFGKEEGTSSSSSPLWCPSIMFGIILLVNSQEIRETNCTAECFPSDSLSTPSWQCPFW